MKFLQMYIIEIQTLIIISKMPVLTQNAAKNVPYNLAKQIIVLCNQSWENELRLNEFRTWLKKISNAFYKKVFQEIFQERSYSYSNVNLKIY